MAAVRYMFYVIFAPNSVAKFFKNTCLSVVEEVATLLR